MATALIDVCVRNKKLELAETLFDDLFGEFVTPDEITFCSLIRGFGSLNDFDWTNIKRILNKMRLEFDIQPSINIYNALLEVCAVQNDVEQAEAFIDQMLAEQIVPNDLTLKTVQNRRSIRKLVRQLDREIYCRRFTMLSFIFFRSLLVAFYLFACCYCVQETTLGIFTTQSYASVQRNPPDVEPTDAELRSIGLCAQKLWDLDDNKLMPGVDYKIDVQGDTQRYDGVDAARNRLFERVDTSVWSRPTYRAFEALLDNYERRTGRTERVTEQELREQDAFLEAIVQTRPMQYVKNYLAETVSSQLVFVAQLACVQRGGSRDDREFQRHCRDLWFPNYDRDARDDSSGFEHVFVGESDIDTGRVSGFHSWIQFYRQEASGNLDYRGYIIQGYGSRLPDDDERVLQLQLEWDGEIKSISSIIVGSSPEFDFALYTLYFEAGRRQTRARFVNRNVEIRCYPIHEIYIGTCYVALRP
eukprot:g6878.t1